MMCIVLAASLLSGCIATPTGYRIKNSVSSVPKDFGEKMVDDAGLLVEVPGSIMMVATFVPFWLLTLPVYPVNRSLTKKGVGVTDDYVPYLSEKGSLSDDVWFLAISVCADTVMTPFWATKKVIWDVPVGAGRKILGLSSGRPLREVSSGQGLDSDAGDVETGKPIPVSEPVPHQE